MCVIVISCLDIKRVWLSYPCLDIKCVWLSYPCPDSKCVWLSYPLLIINVCDCHIVALATNVYDCHILDKKCMWVSFLYLDNKVCDCHILVLTINIYIYNCHILHSWSGQCSQVYLDFQKHLCCFRNKFPQHKCQVVVVFSITYPAVYPNYNFGITTHITTDLPGSKPWPHVKSYEGWRLDDTMENLRMVH